MMNMVPAYHIDAKPDDDVPMMYPVDLNAAVGAHPDEWSKVPWTDDARKEARAARKAKKASAEPGASSTDAASVKDGKSDPGSVSAPVTTPVTAKVVADNDSAVSSAKK